MRSKTVLSRRGLLVGTASCALAKAPEPTLFRSELRETLMAGYARLAVARDMGVKLRPYVVHVKAVFDT